jgi:hypothetical protein
LRAVALLCVLLAAVVGTAQAAHIHGEWLPSNTAHFSLASDGSQGQGEEHCPLCAAMHSALPASMQAVPEPACEVAQGFAAFVSAAPHKFWIFAMFSRPPPVAARTHAAGDASHDAVPAAMAAG